MTALFNIGQIEVTLETVLALSALGLTFYQAWLSRRHNHLSVKPHLLWESQRNWSDEGLTLSLLVKNNGVGPAVIQDIKLSIDGKSFSDKAHDPVEQLAALLFANKVPYHVAAHAFPGQGSAMPSQAVIEFARIVFPGMKKSQEAALGKVLDRANLKVVYECLYGRKLTLDTSV